MFPLIWGWTHLTKYCVNFCSPISSTQFHDIFCESDEGEIDFESHEKVYKTFINVG